MSSNMMKVRSNQSTKDLGQKSGPELAKKLYRSTTELARRLDEGRTTSRTLAELCSPTLQSQRKKFAEYCERLTFTEPLVYGRKCEELLWRKTYYDVINTAKKLRTPTTTGNSIDLTGLLAHINSAIGFYHHYVARLHIEYNLRLQNYCDFILDQNEHVAEKSQEEENWAMGAVYQSLVYLGDLNRYKIEIDPQSSESPAFRYYLQAINLKPDHGMPHNQMGTLAMQRERYLDAVYHYLCCLSCTVTFDGAINNLRNLFDRNVKNVEEAHQHSAEKRFVTRFLYLIDCWYFDKKQGKMYDLCHETYKDLEECLTSKSCNSPTEDTEHLSEVPLNGDQIFKVIAISIMSISKMQRSNAAQISTAVAFTLALYSRLIQSLTNHIEESVLNYPLPDVDYKPEANGIVKDLLKKRTSSSKLRRRKVVRKPGGESSESSEDEEELEEDVESVSSSESFDSEDDHVLAQESSEDEENVKETDCEETTVENDLIKRIKRMDVNDMLEIITEQSSLQAIKIVNDWLMYDTDTIKSCAKNTKSLLRQLANMLNLININVKSSKLTGVKLNIGNVVKNEDKIPLAEDVMLKNIDLLSKAHKNIDWLYLTKRGMNVKEESVVRIVKFLNFGKFLCGIQETDIIFNEKRNIFVWNGREEESKLLNGDSNGIVASEQTDEPLIDNENIAIMQHPEDHNKGLSKMKHMGQLWLASEVKALENQIIKGKTSLSPYLVLDSDALIKYTYMVKHLVHSRKFIVLIPTAVVSALDDLKREQSEARDAIRWLETQFHRGNRFFRGQRPQERAPIPFIKYPKKRDKEMSDYIQIIECCHHLAQQQKGASNVVTLLIGNQNIMTNGENKEFSYVGLAQSAGVAVESMTQFYAKWKKNYKVKR